MANIKITVEGPLMDGHKLTFKAPCDCTSIDKLDVRYIENREQKSKLFTMKDTHGNDLTGIGNLFEADAYVSVVLNTNLGYAYILNADTNGYLENKIGQLSNPNLLINGDFQVWQRGESFENVSNRYIADRWFIGNAYTSTTLVKKSNEVPNNSYNYSLYIKDDYESENSNLTYNVEENFSGEFTLSFWCKTNKAFRTYVFDSNGNQRLCYIDDNNNEWKFYQFTFEAVNLHKINVLHGLCAEGSQEVYITGIKLEQGNIATPFVPRLYAEELVLCQRYFRVLTTGTYYQDIGTFVKYGNQLICTSDFANNMRIASPSVIYSSLSFTMYGRSNGGENIYLTSNGMSITQDVIQIKLSDTDANNIPNGQSGMIQTSGIGIKIHIDAEIY